MNPLHVKKKNYLRAPILLIQSRSIVGDVPKDEVHIAIREENSLIGQWSYRKKVIAEAIDLERFEETIFRLAINKSSHKSLKNLKKKGYFVVYEDDGWLIKCNPSTRVRFMRRSHMFQITICRCGNDVINGMMDDFTLRSLLPVYYFAGFVGKKKTQKAGHIRRTSSMNMSVNDLDISDLLDDYDKSEAYSRIFKRTGSIDGNLLCLDSPFLDCVRSFLEYGGMAKDCIVPNIIKWRRMIKFAAGGDDPYLLMSQCRITNCQWSQLLDVLPNSKFKKFSFSCVYYDGTTKIDGPKIAHKVIKAVKPKQDIGKVFEKQLLMNGSYLIVALSSRGVVDTDIPKLFDNVTDFVTRYALKYGYVTKRLSMGIHESKMIYIDFQAFVRAKLTKQQKQKLLADDEKYNTSDEEKDESESKSTVSDDEKYDNDNDNDDDDDDDFYSNLNKSNE